jgi:hypothetical protein
LSGLEKTLTERTQGQFVCTYCASSFGTRAELAQHKLSDPRCASNANVSNPLQTKYMDANVEPTRPGEYTLFRVRSRDCPHTARRAPLFDDEGTITGYQCTYCFTPLPEDNEPSGG